MMIKQAFDGVLKNWGHSVFLQRHLQGGGFQSTLEEWTVRLVHKSAVTNAMQERFSGVTRSFDVIFYFQSEASPTEGDRIYMPDDRYPTQQTTWIVNFSDPLRGLQGKISFWTVGARRESPN